MVGIKIAGIAFSSSINAINFKKIKTRCPMHHYFPVKKQPLPADRTEPITIFFAIEISMSNEFSNNDIEIFQDVIRKGHDMIDQMEPIIVEMISGRRKQLPLLIMNRANIVGLATTRVVCLPMV